MQKTFCSSERGVDEVIFVKKNADKEVCVVRDMEKMGEIISHNI